ncbi:sensor histidine kinase [Eisenibacter elegans]|jgi:signal transduction histidine kinase|uniref:sensor histidine kinase n=1 Tax=Eisenibacter elegans TaxID=997 RepID=UPI000400F327|nr:histidine kinase [Eisenibacter elegans]
MELNLSKGVPFIKNRLLAHIILWVCYLSFFIVLVGSHKGKYYEEFVIQLYLLPIRLAVVYLSLYVLLPYLLLKQRYALFLSSLFTLLVLAVLLMRVEVYYFIYPRYYPEALTDCEWCTFWHVHKLIQYTFSLSAILFLATSIKILKLWYKEQQNAKSLAQEKLEAELKFLKGQIHPHFLFNVLNNLYALTLKKSDVAPEVVLRLSDLMNYMLYESNTEYTTLEKEVEYLQNYIALEKVRYGDRAEVVFNVSGGINGRRIAPMLLLPFVENAFKHGVSGEIELSWVSLDLVIKDDMLTFKVENSKAPAHFRRAQQDYAHGIGLQNVRRRLELLYKDRHELKIFDEENTYMIVLKVRLGTEMHTHKSPSQVSSQAPVNV